MKYFTKEYRNALQNVGLVEGYEILEHENIDIDFLYKQKEDEFVEHERAIYDSPPIHENDLFSDIELVLEDILLSDFDEEVNEVNFRHPESFEEWEKYKEANHKRRLEEYENREPFDEKEARELFKINFDIAVKDKWQMPEWVYEKVDARLIALYYLPKDIYKELENLSKDSERIIEEIDQLEEKEPYNKLIPEEIIELLELHDANLLKIEEQDRSIFLNIIYGPASSLEGHQRIEFINAEILANEIGHVVIDENGFSNVYFIAREAYNYGDCFGFHFLLDSYVEDEGESMYLTIRAKDLVKNSNPPEEA